jgi:hypothetical protein
MNLNGMLKLLNRITYWAWEIAWSLIGCICGNICESCKGEELLKSKRNIENKILEVLPTQKKRDWAVMCLWIVVAIFLLRGDEEKTQVVSTQMPSQQSYAFHHDVKPTKVESVEKPSINYAATQSKSGEDVGEVLSAIGTGVLEGIGAVVSGIADVVSDVMSSKPDSPLPGESWEDYRKRKEEEERKMNEAILQQQIINQTIGIGTLW